MQKAIIIHGLPSKEEYFNPLGPSQSNRHWLPWIQHQLLINGILAQTPEMPDPYNPDYKKWSETFEQLHPDNNTHLIGHSCGGGFLLRWLSEHDVKVGKVVLVAPWIDPQKEILKSDFFNFQIDPDIASKTSNLTIIASTNDHADIQETVDQIREKVASAKIIELENRGHFTHETIPTGEFPELLDTILK